MGDMNRPAPAYPGGQMSNNSWYGMQGQSYGGYGSNYQMRMNTHSEGMREMRPFVPGQYGMQQGGVEQRMGMSNMGMSNMGMSRSGMMSGPSGPEYETTSQIRHSGYRMGLGSSIRGPWMMRPQSMRQMAPGMMSGMQGVSGISMQGQGGMPMQSGGMQGSSQLMGGGG